MGRLFGTDGARGVAITELTCETAMQIGKAAAIVLTKKTKHKPTIFIGKDTRISSDVLEAALAAGICSVGANAEILGVVPTPAVAALVEQKGADAGVMSQHRITVLNLTVLSFFRQQVTSCQMKWKKKLKS